MKSKRLCGGSQRPWGVLAGSAFAMLLGACSQKDEPAAPCATPVQCVAQGDASASKVVAIARGKIEIEGGLLQMSPAVSASVRRVGATEGQVVQRGQLLLEQDDALAVAAVAVASAELALARERLKASDADLPALQLDAARYGSAAREGAARPQEADAARQRLQAAESRRAIAAAEVEVVQRRLDQAKADQARFALRAPENATVVAQAARPGTFLSSGEVAVTLAPERPLLIRAEVNASYVDAIKVGMRADIERDVDGGIEMAKLPGASIVRVSPVFANGVLHEGAQRGPIRVVECVLEFDSVPQARAGQNVRVIIHDR